MPPGKFWSLRVLQMHFPAFWGPFLFCFVVLRSQPIWTNFEGKKQHLLKLIPHRCTVYWRKKKRIMISKFNHKKLALLMSSTNVSKNRYRSISLNLMLEQNILITITTWQTILFILSPSFLSISAHTLHIFHVVLKCWTLITRRFIWALLQLLRFEGGMSFLLLLLLFPITQDLFLPKIF